MFGADLAFCSMNLEISREGKVWTPPKVGGHMFFCIFLGLGGCAETEVAMTRTRAKDNNREVLAMVVLMAR